MDLNIFLAKKEVDDPLALLRSDPNDEFIQIRIDGRLIGDLIVRRRAPSLPPWVSFFSEADRFDPQQVGETTNVAAVFLALPEDRPFALTFGHARGLLNLDLLEDDFGLRATLNAIKGTSVKSIHKQTFDAIHKQAREQSSREADPREFGLDVEDDLLRDVTGVPESRFLGSQLSGKESLIAKGVPVELENLHDRLLQFYSLYLKDDYKQKFPWVDNIRAVKDPSLQARLDEEILTSLDSEDPGMIWLAAPDIINWNRVCGFTYGESRKHPILHDMHLQTFRESVKELSIDSLRRRYVGAVDGNHWMVQQWPVYKCIHAEISLDGEEYVLSNGQWYKLSGDLVDNVARYVEALPEYELELPPFGHRGEETEGEYNRLAAESREDFLCMDGDLIERGGNRSSIEACDILTPQHDLIHVKRYSGSSGLSHLFAQGFVSGQLLATDEVFRADFNKRIPERYRIEFDRHLPRDLCRVVFAIVSQSRKRLWPPFFSRLNLKNASNLLIGLGYRVALKKIEVGGDRLVKRFAKTPRRKRRKDT